MKNAHFYKQLIAGVTALCLCMGQRALSQSLQPGMDAVVTMYSASPNQPVAMVKRIGDPIGSGAPFNNNWTPPAIAPAITTWTPANMGQVFGTTIDATGNVYFAATAGYYGGTYPSMASLIPAVVAPASIGPNGFHGVGAGNEVGLIYMAESSNLNNVSAIVTAENAGAPTSPGVSSGTGTKKIPNTGYGIGNVAFSARYNRLYLTNLEDGKIYSLIQSNGANNGEVEDIFDPFTADNGTSGIAPHGERLFAIGVNNEFDGTTRVYYSVLKSITAGVGSLSEIWSVALTNTGKFLPATNTLEIQVPVNTNMSYGGTYVSDLAFSVRGEMLVAEKGDPHNANVYQYYGRHNAWSVAEVQYVSDFSINKNSGGGVDYGFVKTARGEMVCDSLIWTMENAWGGVKWYGLQSIPHTGYTGPVSSYPSQAYIVDLDGYPNGDPFNWVQKGRFGDVVFFDGDCKNGGPTDICGKVNIEVRRNQEGCCYDIYVSNQYHNAYFTGLEIETEHLNIDNVTAGTVWGGITYKESHHVVFGDTSKRWYMPKDSSGKGEGFLLANICLSGSGSDVIKITLIGNEPQFDTVCVKEVKIEGCGVPVDTNCVGILNQNAVCENGVAYMEFQVKNNSSFTMRSLTFYPLNPNVKTQSSFFPIDDLAPGAISPVYKVPLIVKDGDTSACFFFSACDLNVFPGTSGQYPKYCCMDSIPYCITIPACDGCDAVELKAVREEGASCCYKLDLTNNNLGSRIKCARFKGVGGTQFAILSGWNIQAPVSSNDITICAPGNGVGSGTYPGFASFCLTGTSTPPHTVTVELLDENGRAICAQDLMFEDCELVEPTCANIVEDSLYCDGKETKLTFSIQNNSNFSLHQVDLRLSDTSFKLDTYLILPDPPIAPGATAGPYTITIDSSAANAEHFCLYLTGHNNVYIPDSLAATQCCTDSLGVICLPFLVCDSTGCCAFEDLIIPNGITPNDDGFNDKLIIQNSEKCKDIAITVFNRWGNIVYQDKQYANNWGGTNNNGKLLPQGTYYIVIELSSGAKKAMYIDIRY